MFAHDITKRNIRIRLTAVIAAFSIVFSALTPEIFALSARTQLSEPEFREKFAAMEFLLAHDAVNKYIENQIKSDIAKIKIKKKTDSRIAKWRALKTKKIYIDDIDDIMNDTLPHRKIRREDNLPKSVMGVSIDGLLAHTGQFAHVGLSGKNYGGSTVIYIDSTFFDYPDSAVMCHEIDEVLQWEDLRINVLRIGDKRKMRRWIVGHIDTADKQLALTEFRGMTSREIAKVFHDRSYSLRQLAHTYKDKINFDYRYINDMFSLYGADNEAGDINIAAHLDVVDITDIVKGLINESKAALARDDFGTAVKKAEEAVETEQDNPHAWNALAQALLKRAIDRKEPPDEAIAVLSGDGGTTLKPLLAESRYAHTVLANALYHAGKLDADGPNSDKLREAIAILSPDGGIRVKSLLEGDHAAYTILAKALDASHRWEDAIAILCTDDGEAIRPLLASDPKAMAMAEYILANARYHMESAPLRAARDEAYRLAREADANLKSGDIALAIENARQAISICDTSIRASNALAEALLKKGDYSGAISALSDDGGRSLKPFLVDNIASHTILADALYRTRKRRDTIAAIDILSVNDGRDLKRILINDIFAHTLLAAMLDHVGRADAATGILSLVDPDDPTGRRVILKPLLKDNPRAHNILAKILDHAGRREEAAAILCVDNGEGAPPRLKPLLAGNPVAHVTLANILLHLGRNFDAIAVLSPDKGGSLRELFKENARACTTLANILGRSGRAEDALSLIAARDNDGKWRLIPFLRGNGYAESVLDSCLYHAALQAEDARLPPPSFSVDVENALYLMRGLILAQVKEGRVYEIRYDSGRMREYQRSSDLDEKNSPEAMLKAYVKELRKKLSPEMSEEQANKAIKLIKRSTKSGKEQDLISVTCFNDMTKRQEFGSGSVNVKGDLSGEVRVVGMLNMALAVSNIPNDTAPEDISRYGAVIDRVKAQYKDITGVDLAVGADALNSLRAIELPRSTRIPVERMEEYYRLTIQQLRQAA